MQLRARFSSDDRDWRENRHDHHQGRARALTSTACRRSSAPTQRDFADPLAPRQDETQKALSGTDDLLSYLIRDEGHRGVMAHDLARFAEENGRPEFAQRLRANF